MRSLVRGSRRPVSITVIRTRADLPSPGQVPHVVEVSTWREVAQQIAWCATDNLGLHQREASRCAEHGRDALRRGEVYTLGQYRFRGQVRR